MLHKIFLSQYCTYLIPVAIQSLLLMKYFSLMLFFSIPCWLLNPILASFSRIFEPQTRVFYFYLPHSEMVCVSTYHRAFEWKTNQTEVVDSLKSWGKKMDQGMLEKVQVIWRNAQAGLGKRTGLHISGIWKAWAAADPKSELCAEFWQPNLGWIKWRHKWADQ